MHKRSSYRKRTVLADNLEELISRNPHRFSRSLPGGVGQGDLASQLTIWTILCWASPSYIGQGKTSQQNRGPDPEDQGGDGVPGQGHRGEGIQVVHVQD